VSTDELMHRLAQLDHHERLAQLIAHARTLPPADADTLIRELFAGDTHRRWLALHVVALRGDANTARAALEDTSLLVRSFAAKLVGRHASSIPATVLDHVDGCSLAQLLGEVVGHGRTEIAETLVTGLLERDRLCEAAYLLPTCSVAFIEARLDAVGWPETVWRRLARYQPELLCARIERSFVAAERPELVWRRHAPTVWARLCERRPAVVAGWVDRFAEADELPSHLVHGGGLEQLVRCSATRVVGWLSTRLPWLARFGLPKGLAARARELDDDVLATIGRALAQAAPAVLGTLLAQLPFPQRARLFERATAELETARIEWPTTLLAVLPTGLRDREAARMLTLARAQTDGTWRRELLGLRSIEAARAELEREGQSSQAAERGEAHAALVLASMRSRTGMAQTLAWLQRIRNEQDPVRMAVLAALARVPGHQLTDPDALDAVVQPIFEARDTSHATRQHAARIAHALLVSRATEPGSPMFGLGLSLLERLAGHQGTPDLPRLDRNLPRGAEQAIVGALLPWLEAARSRQQDQHVFRVWSALGKRAWRVEELAILIVEILWHGNKNHAAQAAAQWVQDPATRDQRVRELVARDRSALYLSPVFEHCQRRRQTLLVERFEPKAPRGRFHDGKVVIVPHVSGGFERWSTELQRRYVDSLRLAEAEPKHFAQVRAALVGMRARVPITTVADLADALTSADVVVQEAALGALVWTDAPAPALPILLDHLDGDRARVAMYALPRLARTIPRERFVDALAVVLARPRIKVTVHKEALRLLGELATPRAMELLREAWQQPLHRDVRIAALHAARSNPNQPQAWTMLASAAGDESPDVARAVVEASLGNIAERHRARYLQTMVTVADHPSPIARAALFTALASGWSLADPTLAVSVAARVIARMDLLDPWRSATMTVAAGGRSLATHASVVQLVEGLATAAEREVAPAGERDRMAHQRLSGVLEALARDRHPTSAVLLGTLATGLLGRLAWWSEGARLQIAATPNDRLATIILELLAAAPTPRCVRAVEHAARAAAGMPARDWSVDAAEHACARFAEGSPAARLVAAAWVAELGPRWGWSTAWTDMLQRLREDSDLDVRTSAREVWMARG
jgi:hypothetical protein